jgi:hypothetical protein
MILLFRAFINRSMMMTIKLFKEALRQENNGFFEKAQAGYLLALEEVKRKRWKSSKMENEIVGKLKLLNTVIGHNRSRNINEPAS